MTPEEIEDIDSDEYDVEAIKIDIRNNNFSDDRLDEYRHENIVAESLLNGQFTQAREQCKAYGLDYIEEKTKFDSK